MPLQAPATIRRLGEQHPRPIHHRRVASGLGDDLGELADDGKLLVTVERASVGQHLDPDIRAVAIDIGDRVRRQFMHERRRVLAEHGDVGDLLNRHDGGGQVGGEPVLSANVPAAAYTSIIGIQGLLSRKRGTIMLTVIPHTTMNYDGRHSQEGEIVARDVRERMIEGAVRLLARHGLQATSFTEVLELTGAPRGSIYHHFPGGKDELISAAVDRAGARALQGLR